MFRPARTAHFSMNDFGETEESYHGEPARSGSGMGEGDSHGQKVGADKRGRGG